MMRLADGRGWLTKELCIELFEYRDGSLFWKKDSAKNVKAGSKAGSKSFHRSAQVKINKTLHLVHRVIFLMHYGYLTENIDHIDGNPENNRIENLRVATTSENGWNSKISVRNKSGVKGVTWNKQRNKWRAYISVNCKNIHLGSFSDIEKAKEAVTQARRKLHGEYANHGLQGVTC